MESASTLPTAGAQPAPEPPAREFRFCPLCATPLHLIERFGAVRPVCPACGFVRFRDPKVAVVALVTRRELSGAGEQVLLVRRAVQPRKGMWALPGGYLDAGEMPHAALQREVLEETGLLISVGALLDMYALESVSGAGGFVMAFAAHPAEDALAEVPLVAADDVAEARWFMRATLPPDLAFDSTRALLQAWAGEVGIAESSLPTMSHRSAPVTAAAATVPPQ